MIFEKIELQKNYPQLKHPVFLKIYAPDNFNEFSSDVKRKAIILLPGGAYQFVSEREGEPVALNLLAKDFVVFQLYYSVVNTVEKVTYPYPLIEAIATLDFIYKTKEKYHVDINHINVMGFSARGHLAATLCTYYKNKEFHNLLGIKGDNFKIDHAIFCYPVITMEDDVAEQLSKENLTHRLKDLEDYYSIEKHIDKNFPKSYIWITRFDTCVQNKNTLILADALNKAGVLYELHIFPAGDHGQSLANEMIYYNCYKKEIEDNARWFNEAINFINKY